jgi:hypothetical protein
MHAERHSIKVVVEQIGVCIERDFRGLVAQHALQRKDIHPGRHRERRTRVTQVVWGATVLAFGAPFSRSLPEQ